MNEYIGKSKKRIALTEPTPSILILNGGMRAGGKERQIIELLKGIKRNNRFRTILAVGHIDGAREAEAAKFADQVWRIKRLSKYDLLTSLIYLLRQAKKYKVDIVHTWGGGIWDMVGWALARVIHIPVIHGGIRAAPLFLDMANKISRWAASHADVVVANSLAGLYSFGFQNNPRARVIYNGVDFSRFVGFKTSPKNSYMLCMVANFSENKDHATLIQALPYIMDSFPQVNLILVGHDAGTLSRIHNKVNELDLSQSVQFVTDTLDPEPYIEKSQICVLSSFTEGISNSILEYMGMHKPVVATMNSGNAEVVETGVTGFLTPPRSPEALADHIIRLFQNPDLARSMGEAGHQRLIKKFSLEQMVTSYEALYSSLLEK